MNQIQDEQDAKKIESFLTQPSFAVAGASTNRDKYGNKVVRVYQQNDKPVYPINPEVLG